MAIEEKVIQPESVTNAEQPVAETTSQPQAPNLDSVKAEYEAKLAAAKKEIAEKEAKGLLTYAFANNVLENVKMQVLKTKIKKIIANKIGVSLGFEL